MAVRLYTVQGCHPRSGWSDLGVYDKHQKPCNDAAKAHTERTGQVNRVIQKPKGWTPD